MRFLLTYLLLLGLSVPALADDGKPNASKGEVYVGGLSNVFSDNINNSDYGERYRVGGHSVMAGYQTAPTFLCFDKNISIDFNLRQSLLRTAWNVSQDDKQYRHGYTANSTEFLAGGALPWDSILSRVYTSFHLGYGITKIKYQLRNLTNDLQESENVVVSSIIFDSQVEKEIYGTRNSGFYVAAAGNIRLTLYQDHESKLGIRRAIWNINFPSLPVPALGLICGTSL
jgi:hypothetical protein